MSNIVSRITSSVTSSINRRIAGYNPYPPLSLEPILWLDSSYLSSITDPAGAVSQWDDKSSSSNDTTQSTGAYQPTSGSRTENSLNAVDFNTTIGFMQFTTNISRTNFTDVFVFNVDDIAADRPLHGFQTDSNSAVYVEITTGLVVCRIQTTLYKSSNSITPTLASKVIIKRSGTVLTIIVDDVTTTHTGVLTNAFVTNRICRSPVGNYDGMFMEAILFDRALNSNEITQLSNYINGKWNTFKSMNDLLPKLWLDASDLRTITHVGGSTSEWRDKSGNANHAGQAVAIKQPSTGTRTLNSLNVLDFDGVNEFFSLTTPILATSGLTICAAIVNDGGATNRTIIGSINAGGVQLRLDATEYLDVVRATQAVIMDGTVAVGTAGSVITATTITAGNATRIDGVDADSNATDPAYTNGIDLIGAILGGQYWDGALCEIVVFQRILSSTEILKVERNLSNKWGL